MGKGAFTTLKSGYFYLHLAEQYSPSFVTQFLQNALIDIFKHLLYMVLQFCFVVFFFSNTITSFYCSSVISELFIYHLQVLSKERSITYDC